jgi:hypothetical protein
VSSTMRNMTWSVPDQRSWRETQWSVQNHGNGFRNGVAVGVENFVSCTLEDPDECCGREEFWVRLQRIPDFSGGTPVIEEMNDVIALDDVW